MTVHLHRRDALRARLDAAGIGAIYVTELANVRYLSGFTGSNGQLLVTPDADGDVLFTDGRYTTQAGEQAPDLPLLVERGAKVVERAVAHLRAAGITSVGFEADRLSWTAGEQARDRARTADIDARPVTGVVEALRAVKDETEIAVLRRACAVTTEAFAALLPTLAQEVTEREVAARLERTMADLGAEAPAFETIVAFGPNSAMPHHRPTDRRLGRGELIKLDFGARVDGYHADMTRTVALGDPGDLLRTVHDLVRSSQAAGVAAIGPGVAAADVDRACREIIVAAGRGDQFTHSTGHGVGLDIHEAPTVGAESRDTLAARMAVTVEPGVYLPGQGGVRIEDTVVVPDADGQVDILTTAPRELIIL